MTSPTESHGVLVVDKARASTSHDVVAVARGALRTRAIGHTGTLDPMATGVLVLVVGEATKLVSSLGALQKRYRATIKLGVSTTTLDAEGEPDGTAPVPPLTLDDARAAAARFLGEHDQAAPLVSAIKRDGRALYKRARSGEAVEAPVRRVRLDAVEILTLRGDEIELDVRCGSGFYVRAFARDLCAALGTLGHLCSLRRTQNGMFGLDQAVAFDTLLAGRSDEAARERVRAHLVPLGAICRKLPHLELDAVGAEHARQGRVIPREHVLVPRDPDLDARGTRIAFDEAGQLLALVEPSVTHLRVVRGFRAG